MDKNLLIKTRDGKIVKFLSANSAQVFGVFGELIYNYADVIYAGISYSKAWKMLEHNKRFLITFETNLKGKKFIVIGSYGLKGGGCGVSSKNQTNSKAIVSEDLIKFPENHSDDKTNNSLIKQQDQQKLISDSLNGLESGVKDGIIENIAIHLQSLRRISLNEFQMPLYSSMRLLNCLKNEGLWEPRSWREARREIVKIAKRLLFYQYHKSEYKAQLFQENKDSLSKLISSIENRILNNESNFPENGTLCDIRAIRSAVKVMKTDQRWYKGLVSVGINLIDCLAKKDLASGLEFLNKAFEILSDNFKSDLPRDVLILEDLRDLVRKNPDAHEQLLQLLKNKNNKNTDWKLLYIILDEIEAVILDEEIDTTIRKKFLEGDETNHFPCFLHFAEFKTYKFKNNWRIREKAASGLAKISVCGELPLQNIAKKILGSLLQKEKDKKVRKILTNPESIQLSQKIIETVWDIRKDPFKELQDKILAFITEHQSDSAEVKNKFDCILVEVSNINSKLDNRDSPQNDQKETLEEIKDMFVKKEYEDNKKWCILLLQNKKLGHIRNISKLEQSKNYQSRDVDVEKLWNMIPNKSDRKATQIAIIGKKGAGKTEVAIEFVIKYRNEFGFIWWIDEANKWQIESSYMEIAKELSIISPSLYKEEVIRQIIMAMEREKKPWLLIFDSVPNSSIVSDFIPNANGVALITSINQNWDCEIYQLESYDKVLISEVSEAPQIEEVISTSPSPVKVPPEPVEKSMIVAIRVRPLNDNENQNIVEIDDDVITIKNLNGSGPPSYKFDKIFQNVNNETVFMNTALNLIQSVLSGINTCVMAYGATGSGKTYTMTGNPDEPGIIPLTIHNIFEEIQSETRKKYDIKISFVQVYNERVDDLLQESSGELKVMDFNEGTKIVGACEIKVKNVDLAMKWIREGDNRRKVGETAANTASSRSHSILIVNINSQWEGKNDEVFEGKMYLIDLAGSEKGNVSNDLIRRSEGKNINQSLHSLKNCIEALAKNEKFIPYRNSKLTRILKGSLGGNCKNVMISNISPSSTQYEEILNTLRFSNEAQTIKGEIKVNISFNSRVYESIISDLKNEIKNLKSQCNYYLVSNQAILSDKERFHKDEAEMKKIKDEIIENFEKWKNLRNDLAEIEEQNWEIKIKMEYIFKWIKNEANEQAEEALFVPESIKNQYKEIRVLENSIEKARKQKNKYIQLLGDNEEQRNQIKNSVQKRIKLQDKQEILYQLIKTLTSEQENAELKMNNENQKKYMQTFIQEEYFSPANADANSKKFEEIINKMEQKGYKFAE